MSFQSSYHQELTSHEGHLRDCRKVWALLAVSQWSLLLGKWPLQNLPEVLISMAIGLLQSKGSERKRKSTKQKPSSFQPNLSGDISVLLHSVGDINPSPSVNGLQKGFHTRRLRSLETILEAVYLSFSPPSNLPLSRSSTALRSQSSLAYSQTSVYQTLETVKSLFSYCHGYHALFKDHAEI